MYYGFSDDELKKQLCNPIKPDIVPNPCLYLSSSFSSTGKHA